MPGVAGYTSEMCQQAMVEEMENLFKGRTFSGQQGMKPLKIYKQFIPIQTDDDDNIDTNESPYPCLIVKETSGTIKKLTAKTQQVLIQLIFCAYDQNVDRQGYVDAVNIKEAIIQHFEEQPVFGGTFKINDDSPVEWDLSDDDMDDYYWGIVNLICDVPNVIRNKEVEKLI